MCFQGLKLLHDSGLIFGHLHASNVIVDDGVCRLADVENGMLGVPSMLRPAFTQLRKINVRKPGETPRREMCKRNASIS